MVEKVIELASNISQSGNPILFNPLAGAVFQPSSQEVLRGVDQRPWQMDMSHLLPPPQVQPAQQIEEHKMEEEIKEELQLQESDNQQQPVLDNQYQEQEADEEQPLLQDEQQVLPDPEQEQEGINIKDIIQRLGVLGYNHGGEIYDVVSTAVNIIKDNIAREDLEDGVIQQETQDMDDSALKEYIKNKTIHSKCRWVIKRNRDGSIRSAEIKCDFEDGKHTYTVR